MKKKRSGAAAIAMTVAALAYLLCMAFVFVPCGPAEDGTWMHCHDAGVAITILAAVILAAAVVHLLVKKPLMRALLCAGIIVLAVLACLVPDTFVRMCMMPQMRCHAVMTPADRTFAIVMIVLAGVNLLDLLNHVQKKPRDLFR